MRRFSKDERPAWAAQPARLRESGFHVMSSLIWGAAHSGPKWLAGSVYTGSVHRALVALAVPHGLCPFWASSKEGLQMLLTHPWVTRMPFLTACCLVLWSLQDQATALNGPL